MAQEFYIDENGNKIPISGTVTSADMLPMSASDSRKVSEAIGALSTITTLNVATTGYSTVGIDLVKCNNTVQFKFTGLFTMPSGGWTKIAQLPNNYRPQMEIIKDVIDNSNRRVRFRLNIDGEVHVYNYGSTISSDFNSYVNFTYIIHS